MDRREGNEMRLKEIVGMAKIEQALEARRKSVDVRSIFTIRCGLTAGGDEEVEFYLSTECLFFTLEDIEAEDWEVVE